jgi:hypothetical protein
LNVRKLGEEDRPLLAEWMAADPYHVGYSPDLFFAQGTEGAVFDDGQGPLFFVALSKTIRAFVQFAPGQKERIRDGLPLAFAWVASEARKGNFQEIIFESKSPSLIRFCKKRLGFRESPHEFISDICG